MSHITVQHLEYLVALIDERHVTRAAERVGIGQPAMSTALAKLRLVFKDPLLVKTSTGMEPTKRALDLVRRAHESIDLLSGAERVAEHFDPAKVDGHFRFMSSDGVANEFLPEFMQRIRQLAPNLRFTVSPGDIRRAAEYLRDGEFELVMGFFRQPSQELHQAPLYRQRLVCIASAQHPSVRDSLTFEQFTANGHVVWGAPPVPYPALETIVDEAMDERGVARRVVLRAASMSSSASIVAGTDLLAVVPERIAIESADRSRLQILRLPFPVERIDVTMLWHDRWHRDPLHAWLRSILGEVSHSLKARLGGKDKPA